MFKTLKVFLLIQWKYSYTNKNSIHSKMTITLQTSMSTRIISTTTSTTTTTTPIFTDGIKTEAWQQQFDDMFNATVIYKFID